MHVPFARRNLDEIFAGEYEGMTYAEIEARVPDEASLRKMDKIGYRYESVFNASFLPREGRWVVVGLLLSTGGVAIAGCIRSFFCVLRLA